MIGVYAASLICLAFGSSHASQTGANQPANYRPIPDTNWEVADPPGFEFAGKEKRLAWRLANKYDIHIGQISRESVDRNYGNICVDPNHPFPFLTNWKDCHGKPFTEEGLFDSVLSVHRTHSHRCPTELFFFLELGSIKDQCGNAVHHGVFVSFSFGISEPKNYEADKKVFKDFLSSLRPITKVGRDAKPVQLDGNLGGADSEASPRTPAPSSMLVVPEEVVPEKPQEPTPPPPKPKKLERRKSAIVGREASEWKPYPVKKIGGGGATSTTFLRLVRKIAVKAPAVEPAEPPPEGEAPKEKFTISYKGKPSKARAAARTYKSSGQQLLIVSIYPLDLKSSRIHLELRFIVDEGFLQNAKIAGVRILGDGSSAGQEKWDSRLLRRQGIEFEEWAPSGGRIEIAHLDPLPGARGFNAGKVFMAEFGDKKLGAVNLTYSVSGVAAP